MDFKTWLGLFHFYADDPLTGSNNFMKTLEIKEAGSGPVEAKTPGFIPSPLKSHGTEPVGK